MVTRPVNNRWNWDQILRKPWQVSGTFFSKNLVISMTDTLLLYDFEWGGRAHNSYHSRFSPELFCGVDARQFLGCWEEEEGATVATFCILGTFSARSSGFVNRDYTVLLRSATQACQPRQSGVSCIVEISSVLSSRGKARRGGLNMVRMSSQPNWWAEKPQPPTAERTLLLL